MKQTILFVGGTRSGKSALAQAWAENCGQHRLYVATAANPLSDTGAPIDHEMHERIEAHKAARGEGWTTLENPTLNLNILSDAVTNTKNIPQAILIDCLTLWLGHIFMQNQDTQHILKQTRELATWAKKCPIPVAFVSSELGQGIVPANALSRAFRDAQGLINQHMAATCDNVVLVNCGLPSILKGTYPL